MVFKQVDVVRGATLAPPPLLKYHLIAGLTTRRCDL